MIRQWGPKPKAYVSGIVPEDLKTKIEHLLILHKRIPINKLALIFYFKYKYTFDATSRGFKYGLNELIDQLSDMVVVNEKSVCRLSSNYIVDEEEQVGQVSNNNNNNNNDNDNDNDNDIDNDKENHHTNQDHNDTCPRDFVSFVKKTHERRKYKDFFSPGNVFLWHHHEHIRTRDLNEVLLVKTPYQKGLLENRQKMIKFAKAAHYCLLKYPNGLPMDQLYLHFEFDKRFLNQVSIAHVVFSFPEIFFTVADEQQEFGITNVIRVFSGRARTFDKLNGEDLKSSTKLDPYRLASSAIVSGVYQMTLILIKKARNDGLRLCAWQESLRLNFSPLPDRFINDVLDELDPLTFFFALASIGLVSIKSSKNCKNDLRVHLPTERFDCEHILLKGHSRSGDRYDC